MTDEEDPFIPRKYRINRAEDVRQIWRKVPADKGAYASDIRRQVGRGAQEILDEVVRDWIDRNIVKVRNPSNPILTRRPKSWWESVDCPRCGKSFRARSLFEEHWKDEARVLSPGDGKSYLSKMKEQCEKD